MYFIRDVNGPISSVNWESSSASDQRQEALFIVWDER